ncbi:MAG: OmpA family protein [Lewinellaceae bacterium]|nr:OmpA family protein [Lewinellaceae bacterium]
MKLPLWLIGLLFVGYSVWAVNFWHCRQCGCCDGESTEQSKQATTGVPLFQWNADHPVADAKFPDWKKNFLATGGQGDTLVITGLYREGEANGDQLAFARANAIKSMLLPEMPSNRIQVHAKQSNDGKTEADGPLQAAEFTWLKLKMQEDKVTIITTEDEKSATFLFPYNSTQRIQDKGVDDFLKKMVANNKDKKSSFSLVGHTDNSGDDAYNLKLGKARAESVADVLKANGIDPSRIQVSSKGEAEPAADNNTEEGQRQNRRVVLTVNN